MNERIKELAIRAGAEHFIGENSHLPIGRLDKEGIEKFADSLVWECMKICEDVMKKDNSALACWSAIKGTFRS